MPSFPTPTPKLPAGLVSMTGPAHNNSAAWAIFNWPSLLHILMHSLQGAVSVPQNSRVYLGAEGAVVGGPPPLSTAVTFSCCPAGTFPAPSSLRFFVCLLRLRCRHGLLGGPAVSTSVCF